VSTTTNARTAPVPHDLFDPVALSDVLRRVRALSPERRPRWGSMTAHEMVCHLCDAFRMPVASRPLPRRGNVLHRTLFKWIAFRTPMPWPKGAPTLRELNQAKGGTPPADFAQDVAHLEALIERFIALEPDVDRSFHPLFGRMTRRDWAVWAYRHTDHHLRQFGL
jgi:hypothetical protein